MPSSKNRELKVGALILAGLSLAAAEPTPAPSLKPELSGLSFLVGRWSSPTRGVVAETGGASAGDMSFTPAVGGAVLLRNDHVRLYSAAGAPAGGFDIMMMIYAEGGTIHADYADGDHIIHYTSANVQPGRSATFISAPSPTAPMFKLSFALSSPKVMTIDFSMAAPGGGDFHSIATGSAMRTP